MFILPCSIGDSRRALLALPPQYNAFHRKKVVGHFYIVTLNFVSAKILFPKIIVYLRKNKYKIL